jgi:hypothetical protein
MSRTLQKRGFAVVLALALVLAAPAHAAGLPGWADAPTLLHSAWQWLDSLLPGGVRFGAHTNAPRLGSTHESVKLGVDPNGNQMDSTPPTPSDADKGAGVDPNG